MHIKKLLESRLVTVAAGAAIIGLIGAGAGWSAATITSADIANDTVRSKDVKDGNLKVKDLNAKAVAQLKGSTGATGPQGPQGPAGAAGSARAFGSFAADGTPTNPARVKNITVTHPSVGIYCLTAAGVDVNTTIPVATTDFSGPATADTITMVRSAAPGCPVGTFQIQIFDASAGTAFDSNFSVLIP